VKIIATEACQRPSQPRPGSGVALSLSATALRIHIKLEFIPSHFYLSSPRRTTPAITHQGSHFDDGPARNVAEIEIAVLRRRGPSNRAVWHGHLHLYGGRALLVTRPDSDLPPFLASPLVLGLSISNPSMSKTARGALSII
jgi:hypothetical protein